ncbi:uncharacterized protein ACHE_30345A [Aspergillus chevalieri]|uniref:Uncharacterized protein n=1 Tax=Aspergillus chevalieri TaxID=182096 RepID=A0A7R7ZLE2_ASPCH|nr:uncharacterized protein ACHE_30345A [Aspergillus chevalieri]BCR86358.1 hypothetical protein ACHE_30345A [Aspergillus chevalieri]
MAGQIAARALLEIATNTIRPGRSRNIDCVFPRGEEIRGERRWGYNKRRECFISLRRIGDYRRDDIPECRLSIPPPAVDHEWNRFVAEGGNDNDE